VVGPRRSLDVDPKRDTFRSEYEELEAPPGKLCFV
jgi:hypothetical protein